MSKRRKSNWQEDVLRLAEQLTSAQPSEIERQAALGALDLLIDGLKDIRNAIASLPGADEIRELQGALSTLEGFFNSAKLRPGVVNQIAVLKQPQRSIRCAPERHSSAELAVALDKLRTEDIQQSLLDTNRYSRAELTSLARHLGIEISRSMQREDIVDRIVKIGFANRRGYTVLGRSPVG